MDTYKKINKASLFFKDKNQMERKLRRKTNCVPFFSIQSTAKKFNISLAFNLQTHTPAEMKEKGKKTIQIIYFK